jgi:hypothetical protein
MNARGEGRATFTRGRRFAIGLNVLVASRGGPLAGGLLVYLVFRPEVRQRFDWTERRSFTLSERTLKVLYGLQQLEDVVDVYTVFRPTSVNDSGVHTPGLELVIQAIGMHCNDVVRELEVRSRGRVRAHAYDPNFTGHLQRINELSALIGERAVNVAIAVHGSRRRVLKLQDLAAYDTGAQGSPTYMEPRLHGFRDEESLVRAILSVTEEREIRLGFLRGHGERNPAAAGIDPSGRAGLNGWAQGLAGQNYQLRMVDLAGAAPLTREELDVLVIADPVEAIAEAEAERIARFAREGGRLAVLLGPNATTALDFPLLEQSLGVTRTPHPVGQETAFGDVRFTPNVFFTDVWSNHPIARPLKAERKKLLWRDACPVRALGGPQAGDIVVEPLSWTGNDAWLDRPDAEGARNHAFDPASEEKAGPYELAVAVTRPEGGRAVVVGCGNVFDDAHLNELPGNRVLAINLIDWLTDREQFISSVPVPFDVVQVDLTQQEYGRIFLYVVAGIPGLALLLGIAVYWLRRS